MLKVNRTINWLIFISISIYVVGLTAYTWLAPIVPYETPWDKFYFLNDNFLKFCIPLFCGLLMMIKPLKVFLLGLAAFQFIIFCFSIIDFLGYDNIVLYKILTLVTVLILIIYVSRVGIYKE
jgi:hypothetical protein